MNTQKSRFAAVVSMLLVVCMMVTTFVIPASAASVPVTVYNAKFNQVVSVASLFEHLQLDLCGYDSYIDLASAVGATGQSTFLCTENGDYFYFNNNFIDRSISFYNQKTGSDFVFEDDFRIYYMTNEGQKFYKFKNINVNARTSVISVYGEFTYHTNSAFVNAIPDNGLSSVFDSILEILPIALVAIVAYIGLRKGIDFVKNTVRGG